MNRRQPHLHHHLHHRHPRYQAFVIIHLKESTESGKASVQPRIDNLLKVEESTRTRPLKCKKELIATILDAVLFQRAGARPSSGSNSAFSSLLVDHFLLSQNSSSIHSRVTTELRTVRYISLYYMIYLDLTPFKSFSEELDPPHISRSIVISKKNWQSICRFWNLFGDGMT